MYHFDGTHPRKPPFLRLEREYKKTKDYTNRISSYTPLKDGLYRLYEKYHEDLHNEFKDEEAVNEYQLRLQELREEMKYYGIPLPDDGKELSKEVYEALKEQYKPIFDYFDPKTHPRQPPFLRPKREYRRIPNFSSDCCRNKPMRECFQSLYDKYFEWLYKPKLPYIHDEESIYETKLRLRDIAEEMEYYGIPTPYTDKNGWLDYWKEKNIKHWGFLTSNYNNPYEYYKDQLNQKFPFATTTTPKEEVKERGKGRGKSRYAGGCGGKSSWI
jgi:hypothetical protein